MIKIWKELSAIGRIVIFIWLICLIALAIFLVSHNKKNKDTKKNQNTAEVAQSYEPSIGTPLPPDVQPNGNPPANIANIENRGEVEADSTTDPIAVQDHMTAPNTGVNIYEPIEYENENLKFNAKLPELAQVIEQKNIVKFNDKAGILYYLVSVNDLGNDTLTTIEAQLKNSTSVKNIFHDVFGSNKTKILKFQLKDYGQGMALISNNNVYYLFGNSKYFPDFEVQ